jgi:hypothetical protein
MELRQRARCDIMLELTWSINRMGPKRSITYTLRGLDAYTNNDVASVSGTGEPMSDLNVPTPQMLKAAVNDNMNLFCERLDNHFNDMFENGREVAIFSCIINRIKKQVALMLSGQLVFVRGKRNL